MKKILSIVMLMLASILFQHAFAQNTLKCGLLTNISLTKSSKPINPSKADIDLLSQINNELKVSTYMNKTVNEGSNKIIISLFTTGTYDDFIKQINSSKCPFLSQKSYKKNNVKFTFYSLKISNRNITRVVFSEPDLTLCLALDLITTELTKDYDALYNEIINRINFSKVKK
jgi:hypothetical protein